jgi:sulfate/thiosulfate transport system permease protein
MARSRSDRSVLPGFRPTLAFTLLYLGLIVLLPLSALFLKTAQLSWTEFVGAVASPRAVASYRLTFGAAFVGAAVNVVFGTVLAWTLVRYRFPGRRFVDALVDLPFALPTAVSGIALTAVYSKNGWIGSILDRFGIQAAFSPLGVAIAMTFIGLPFVVRTLQPALLDLEPELEEAAPAIVTGFALALARALGEYGSVIFISGNMPMRTEISALLIVTKLEQYDYAGATAIAVVLLLASFAILLAINLVQRRARRVHGGIA